MGRGLSRLDTCEHRSSAFLPWLIRLDINKNFRTLEYALITGASKGIGKSIACGLAREKYNLLLLARSEALLKVVSQELQSAYGIEVHYLACDLTVPNAAQTVTSWCTDNKYDVSILVNNAGYGLWGKFENLDACSQSNMMQLNMRFPVELIAHLLPSMKKLPCAYILNIASTAAYQAVPTMSVYSASKTFLLAFSRGLSYELHKTNVSVTAVSPGVTRSDFMERANMSDELKKTAEKFIMESDTVANIAIKAMFAKKTEVVTGALNKIGAWINRILPKSLMEKSAASIYEKHLH